MDSDRSRGKSPQASSLSLSSITTQEHSIDDSRHGYSMHDWTRFSQNLRDFSAQQFVQVTAEELAKHSVESDAWTCVRGIVYNITPFLKYHPGGKRQLMRAAGKESTSLFNKVHTWVNAERILSKCVIGALVSTSTDIEISGDQTEIDSPGLSLSIPVPTVPKQ
ncbi:hypothetical protein EMCRGX_G014863 [Ephydatia muelleri]